MGALYVSNPRGANGRFKKARKANPSPKRHKKRRKNPASQQKMFAAPKRKRRAARKAKTAVQTTRRTRRSPPRPRVSKRWTYAKNPRGSRRRYASRRKRNGGRRARNALMVSNPMGGIPVLGTAVAMIAPAFFGAIGIELIGQGRKVVARFVEIPDFIEPYEFTLVGLLLAGVVQLFTFIPAPIRHSIGIGLASAGSAVDWFRFRNESHAYGQLDMGDGGEWEVQTMGDGEAYGALDLSGIDFSGDEDYCGEDFNRAEGEAMDEGYGAYLSRFPLKFHPRARAMAMRPRPNTPAEQIHDPRREGDRWHWLARMLTPEDMKKLINMPPEMRLRQIAACKQACKNAVHRRMEAGAPPLPPRQIPERSREVLIPEAHVRYEAFSTQSF